MFTSKHRAEKTTWLVSWRLDGGEYRGRSCIGGENPESYILHFFKEQ